MTVHSLTGTLVLVAGADLLSRAVAGIALDPRALAHPEAALPTLVARLAAQTPVVPTSPVTPT